MGSREEPPWLLPVGILIWHAWKTIGDFITTVSPFRGQWGAGAARRTRRAVAVTSAGALLETFQQLFGELHATSVLPAFHATFVCVGLITSASAWIFVQLARDDQHTGKESVQHMGEL